MNNTIRYKNYVGSIEFSETDEVFFGKVLGIRALISYEGTTVKELVSDFHNAINDYLIMCEEEGLQPEMPYKGSFNVRIPQETHRDAAIYALSHGITLNSFVETCIKEKLQSLQH